jgi:hypothetical protein
MADAVAVRYNCGYGGGNRDISDPRNIRRGEMKTSLRSVMHALLASLLAVGFLVGRAEATIVNVDVDPRVTAHSGDDGVFSTPGGTTWNVVGIDFLHDVNVFNLLDEFNAPTGFDLTFSAEGSLDANARPIELYKGGGTGVIEIKNLSASYLYDLAVYAGNATLSVTVTDMSGPRTAGTGATFDLELPGDEGEEYVIFESLAPFDLGGGMIGLTLETASPTPMAGFQLNEIPEPATGTLLGLGCVALVQIRRRPTSAWSRPRVMG